MCTYESTLNRIFRSSPAQFSQARDRLGPTSAKGPENQSPRRVTETSANWSVPRSCRHSLPSLSVLAELAVENRQPQFLFDNGEDKNTGGRGPPCALALEYMPVKRTHRFKYQEFNYGDLRGEGLFACCGVISCVIRGLRLLLNTK